MIGDLTRGMGCAMMIGMTNWNSELDITQPCDDDNIEVERTIQCFGLFCYYMTRPYTNHNVEWYFERALHWYKAALRY